MKKQTKLIKDTPWIVAVITLSCLGIYAGWLLGDVLILYKYKVTSYEFVCYNDGVLTERHVGVSGYIVVNSGRYEIRYADSEESVYYMQKPGETCGLEAVVPSK